MPGGLQQRGTHVAGEAEGGHAGGSQDLLAKDELVPRSSDAAGPFNLAAALELAVRASWYVRDQSVAGLVQPGVKVRLGAGVAQGSKTVCGFLSSSGSAHRWSVFGDGATEAITLASYGAHVSMSARALERLQSPSTWGVSYDAAGLSATPAGMTGDAKRDQQQ